MAELNNFDAETVEPSVGYEPLPAGQYLAIITDSEMKPTQKGTGRYLALTFEVLEGPCQGRLLWARLNLENPNPKAVKMAHAELSSICRAVGVLRPTDSSQLHDLPLLVTVRCKKRADSDDLENVIKGYDKKEVTAGQPQQAAPGTPPWKR